MKKKNLNQAVKFLGKFVFSTTIAAAGLSLSTATSHAQLVLANNVNVATTATYSGPSGTASASQNSAFSNGSQSGNISSEAFLPGTGLTDPTGFTGVTFAYQVSETGSDFIDTMTLDGFGSLSSVYVEYAGGLSAPTTVNLFDGVLTIEFNPNAILTGSSSDVIYVFTTASNYDVNSATVDDGVSANAADLAPSTAPVPSPVPEASTIMAGMLMLLPLGIGAIRAFRKERTA